jgi:hypothetical protein
MRGSSPRMTMWGCASFYSSFRGAASAKSGISDYEGSLLIILVVIFVFQQTSPFSGLLGGFLRFNLRLKGKVRGFAIIDKIYGLDRKGQNRAATTSAAFDFWPKSLVVSRRLAVRRAFPNALKNLL